MPMESKGTTPIRLEPTMKRPTAPQGGEGATNDGEGGKEKTTIETKTGKIEVQGEKSNEKAWETIRDIGLVVATGAVAAIAFIIGRNTPKDD